MTHHPYLAPYSLLPNLKKIDKKDIFQIAENKYLEQKQISINIQKCFMEKDITQEIYDVVCKFIVENHPTPIKPPYDFYNIAMQIQEDLVIHRISDNSDWVASIHACYPGGWSPEEKIGETWDQIHGIIPGLSLNNSRKLVEAMVYNGPFERFVWGIVYDCELNNHPKMPKSFFNQEKPFFRVKIERQITHGFPEHKAMLFVLRQSYIEQEQVDKPALLKTLLGMTTEQRKYKAIIDNFIQWLKNENK